MRLSTGGVFRFFLVGVYL